MALIIEDGTGIESADSYMSLEDLASYAARFGVTSWIGLQDDSQREIFARKASYFIEWRYASKMTGTKVNILQGLAFPRTDMNSTLSEQEIFMLVKKAAIEACMLYSNGQDLLPAKNLEPNVISKSLANGAISTSWDKDSFGKIPVYRSIESILYPLFGYMTEDEETQEYINSIPIDRV